MEVKYVVAHKSRLKKLPKGMQKSTGRWVTPTWEARWVRKGKSYVRSACTFEVRFTPKGRPPAPKDGGIYPVDDTYPRCYFPSAELWRIHHNGSQDLLIRLWTYACPTTKEKAFDVLTDLGRKLGVWV